MLSNATAFDCETHRIQPGLLAPPLVCASDAVWNGERSDGTLMLAGDARNLFVSLLSSDRTIVGANIAYDMLVMAQDAARRGIDLMPLIFDAYEAGRVFDIQIAEALNAIATGYLGKDPRTASDPFAASPLKDPTTGKRGRYSLAICVDLVLGRVDAKANDRFRQSYALLEGVPIEQWPAEARIYPVDDACNTLDVALAQAGLIPRADNKKQANLNLHDLSAQTYAAFAMHLGAAWGFAIDPVAVDALETRVKDKREKGLAGFLELGFLRAEKGRHVKNTGAVKRATAAAYGCSEPCKVCLGVAKVASSKTGKLVGCRVCDSSGLDLDKAPVPRTAGSSCRSCKGLGCAQCQGQAAVAPGCSTSRDALSESGDENLIEFASFLEEEKLLGTYLPFLKGGIVESETPESEDE